MRYLAIDHGRKRTGLAICDAGETVVSPHSVIETKSNTELINRIISVVDQEAISTVVIGLPFNMDETEGPRAKEVRAFAAQIEERLRIPVVFYDERLSSFEAEQLIVDFELTRKKKKKRLDAIAAAEILKGFLASKI